MKNKGGKRELLERRRERKRGEIYVTFKELQLHLREKRRTTRGGVTLGEKRRPTA